MALGVQFTEGHVEKLNLVGKGDSSIKINSISVDCKGKKRSIPVRDDDMVVNAAGAWAGHLLDSSIDSFSDVVTKLPVKRKKRCIFTVHCRSKTALIPPQNTPLVIDPSGVYFRPEGRPGQFLMGVSPDEIRDRDCVDEDLNCVDHELFDDIIWPHIANRVKAFEEIKVVSSWAGFYDYNILDQVGVAVGMIAGRT
jgi:glycine/D-amino acid oxidase-like deaminating enzyme